MDLDTAVETSKLQNMLGLAALKFHRWTVDGVLSQHREKQSTRHALEQSTSDLLEKADHLRSMASKYSDLISSADDHVHSKELLLRRLECVQANIARRQQWLQSQGKIKEENLDELELGVKFFQQRLGFSVRKTPGYLLQVVFTLIDPKNPDEPFFFFMKLDEQKKYHISGCEPKVVNLQELVDKLNSTNNLSSFILSMRRKFQESVDYK